MVLPSTTAEQPPERVASLDQTLQVFRALIAAEGQSAIGDADALVWAYLRPMRGLSAQLAALDVLRRETVALSACSAFKSRLLDDLDRHRQRLSEKSI